jgi:hypothetical protein
MPLIEKLAAHKKGNARNLGAAQQVIDAHIVAFLNGTVPQWVPSTLTPRARADGYDALLGLLPGIVTSGYCACPEHPGQWQSAVVLRNLATPLPPWPISQGAGLPMSGSRVWIRPATSFPPGIDDSGILCLDLSLWG